MITQEIINRGGSKLEITRAIIEQGLDIPVPVSAWRYYDDNLAPLITSFQKMRKPVIVRGSHPNDYHGFIDVVPTIRDINTTSDLEKAVKTIEGRMRDEDVKTHCEDWQQEFSPEVHILMQEQSPSPITGGMLRHPHREGGYFIQYRDLTDNGPCRFPCSYAMINLDCGAFYSGGMDKRSDEELRGALEMFKKLEESGILEKEWAYQVEFGFDPLLFFQARPFKRMQPAQDFKVPYSEKQLGIYSHCSFGITPKEGVELDFLFSSPDELEYSPSRTNSKIDSIEGKAGLIQTRKFHPGGSSSIDLKLKNLVCFCSPCVSYDFLFHENYRFMKKAEISMTEAHIPSLHSVHLYDLPTFKRARVYSNGFSGAIIPEN